MQSTTSPLRRASRLLEKPLFRYLLPFFAIFMALVAQGLVASMLGKGKDFPYAFFYLIAVFATAWLGGYAPGAIACVITMVGLPLATTPGFQLTKVDPSRLILFIGVSLLISRVADTQRRMREVLRQANEELDKRVQSRTQDLAKTVEALESENVQRKKTEEKLQTQLERLNLLDQITRAIGERQDLQSIFQVAIRSLEDSLPIDFGCICLYDSLAEALTVTRVGVRSEALAMELAMPEQARIEIDQNGLSQCVRGRLVYEADVSQARFSFSEAARQRWIGRNGGRALAFGKQGLWYSCRRTPGIKQLYQQRLRVLAAAQ